MRLFASDYDGTFLRNERSWGEIKNNIKMAKKWQSQGNLFVFATGRSVKLMEAAALRGLVYDYIVAVNGGLVADRTGKFIFESKLSEKTIDLLKQHIDENRFSAYFITDGFYTYNQLRKFSEKLTFKQWIGYKLMDLYMKKYEISLEEILSRYPVQIAVTLENQKSATDYADYLTANYPEELSAFANLVHVDISAPNTSKAAGIEEIAKIHNISPENIYVMGDSFNDVPMLEKYTGFTTPEAVEDIKDKSQKIYTTVGEALADLM